MEEACQEPAGQGQRLQVCQKWACPPVVKRDSVSRNDRNFPPVLALVSFY
ncbi:hypothetical protein ACRRTK_008019 [Alexandromys fortis]